jgi:hypothetical protein
MTSAAVSATQRKFALAESEPSIRMMWFPSRKGKKELKTRPNL